MVTGVQIPPSPGYVFIRFALLTATFFVFLVALTACTSMNNPEHTYKGYETPSYTVTKSDGSVELRRYAPKLAAEVTVSGEREKAINEGFRILAGYIFGNNLGQASVAMTSPVTQSPVKIEMTSPVTQVRQNAQGELEGDRWTVQFTMPSRYTVETLPQPKDSRIRFIPVPGYSVVAIRFSWLATSGNIRKHLERLQAYITAHHLKTVGDYTLAYYDSPFTLPWTRRNEIMYSVAE